GVRDSGVVEGSSDAVVARGAHHGLCDTAGDASQIADCRIEASRGDARVAHEAGQTLGRGEAHAVRGLTGVGHERAEADAGEDEGVVALTEGTPLVGPEG